MWAQEKSGGYQLLVVNGPAFLKTAFLASFPSGFSGATVVTLVRVGATPPPVATPTPVVGPPATSTFGAAIAQMLFQKTNEQRAANGGLAALTSNAALTAAAAAYADVVFARDPYLASVADAHSLDGQPADRATRAGYVWSRIGENIAVASGSTQPTATAAAQLLMDGWMNSPPHRANILTGAFTETAVVCSTGRPSAPRNGNEYVMVCVAMFGTPQ